MLLLQLSPLDYKCRSNLHGRHRFGSGTTCKDCGRAFMDAHAAKVFCNREYVPRDKEKATAHQKRMDVLSREGVAVISTDAPEEHYGVEKWHIAQSPKRCMNCRGKIPTGFPYLTVTLGHEEGVTISVWCMACEVRWPSK